MAQSILRLLILNALVSKSYLSFTLERVRRIELLSLAWKAKVIPLYDTRLFFRTLYTHHAVVEGVGFEPTKAEPADLQSAPVDRLGTPPKR